MNGEIKKSDNPFKMWGSYIGVLFFLGVFTIHYYGIYSVPVLSNLHELLSFIILATLCDGLANAGILSPPSSTCFYFAIFSFPVIFGFLIGWVIHSLIRKIRNQTGSNIVQ